MTRYLTFEQFLERRGEAEIYRLAGQQAGQPNLERIEAAIRSAEDEATSYLAVRYRNLPATPAETPGVLKDKVAALAHAQLGGWSQLAPALKDDAQAARDWLSRVARGIASLGLEGAPAVDQSRPEILVSVDRDRSALTFETLRDM